MKTRYMTIIAIIVSLVLIGYVMRLSDRIDRLELQLKRLAAQGTVPVPQHAAAPAQVPPVSAVAPVRPQPQAVPQPLPPPAHSEFKLGSAWFTGAGIVAVLLGAGFFFRYAVVNGLISETMRIALGCAFGAILLGIGLWLARRYRAYGVSLVGAGLGVIYLSCYAAYALYGLVSFTTGLGLLALVTAAGVGFALALDARRLATAAFLGGYLGVYLFAAQLSLASAFAMLLLLAFATIAVNYRKHWPEEVALSLVATTCALLGWTWYHDGSGMVAFALMTALYVVFALATLLSFTQEAKRYAELQAFTLYAVPVGYFAVVSATLATAKQAAALALGIAVFYAALAAIVRALSAGSASLTGFAHAAGLIVPAFVALAIGLYFDGDTTAMLLSVEGALVVAVALRFGNRFQYAFGQGILTLGGLWASFSVFILDTAGNMPDLPILNSHGFTLLALALAAAGAWLAHMKYATALDPAKVAPMRAFDALGMYAALILLALEEVWRTQVHDPDATLYAVALVSLIALGVYGLANLAKEQALRVMTYVLFLALALVLMGTDLTAEHASFLANAYMLALPSVLILAAGIAYVLRSGTHDPEFSAAGGVKFVVVLANITAFVVLTREISAYFDLHAGIGSTGYQERLAISVFWLLYALVALVLGIFRRSVTGRQIGIVLLALAGLKVFLYDALELSDFYRFASFFALGIILLIVGYLYYRYRERIESLIGLPPKQ